MGGGRAEGRARHSGSGRRWRRDPGLGTGRAPLPCPAELGEGQPALFALCILGSGRIGPGMRGRGGIPPSSSSCRESGSPGRELRQTCKRLLEMRLHKAGAPAPGERNPLSVPPLSTWVSPGIYDFPVPSPQPPAPASPSLLPHPRSPPSLALGDRFNFLSPFGFF